jgi:trimeric autotransporter adhesin
MRADKRISVAMFIALTAVSGLWGQTFQGGIRGAITDNSGAAVADAKVTLTDEATTFARSTLTNEAGGYSFTALDPATYTVSVVKPGFKVLERKGNVVGTQEFLTVDLKLEVGEVTQSVNVTSDAPVLETENASTGQLIDKQKLDDLPNMGRNPFYQTVKISQNVTPGGDPKFNRMEDQSGSSQISINGGPVTGNNYLIDGIAITNSANQAVIVPAIEATQEVKLQISTYDAEVGRTGGGTFNMYLRSGTNQLHFSAFGYEWFNPLIANNYFANEAGIPKVPQMWHNYGGAIGGPVVIPKLYNGKNKTFFWVATENYRQNQTSSTDVPVPTALEKAGNFSQSKYSNGSELVIYNPLTTVINANGTYTRQPFPNNIIPASQLSPIGLALASYYPSPTSAPAYYAQPDFAVTTPQYDRAGQLDFKADQQITSWWRASGSFLFYGSREPGYAYWNQTSTAIASPNQTVLYRNVDATQANTTLTPNATTVVYLRWGFNRYPNSNVSDSHGINLQALGFSPALLNSFQLTPGQYYFPAISMSDVESYGGAGPNAYSYYSRSFSGTVSKFLGRHSLKFGGDFRSISVAGITSGPTVGAYSFTNGFTSAENASGSTILGTGAALASLLLGYPASGSATTTVALANRDHYYAVFAQDDFRLNNKLTLNFGMRYEYEGGVYSPNNTFNPGFNPTAVNPIQSQVTGITTLGVLEYAGQNGYGTSAFNPNHDKFGPRAGFAYALTPKTIIRGGYGLFWAPLSFSLQQTFGYTATTTYVSSNDGGATPANSLSNPFPTGVLQPSGNTLGLLAGIGGQNITAPSDTARSTRVHQYSLDVQRELPGGFVVTVGFAGSLSHDLVQGTPSFNINQLPDADLSLGTKLTTKVANPFYGTAGGVVNLAASTTTLLQTLLPFPEFGTVTVSSESYGRATYYSTFAKVQKRLSFGLNFLSTVTWSQNEDNSNSQSNTYAPSASGVQDYYNYSAEWGLALINTPWRWTSATNYKLPLGKGEKFLNNSSWLDLAVGGWAINLTTTMQTGFPVAISQSNLNSGIGTGGQRPNATGISPVTSGSLESRLNDYINPAAFSQAPVYTFGNVSRTIGMRGPGQANVDFSLFKTYSAKEKLNIQFRFEVFNLTNTPLFDALNTTFGNAAFGTITNQANYPRIVQLGLRFSY